MTNRSEPDDEHKQAFEQMAERRLLGDDTTTSALLATLLREVTTLRAETDALRMAVSRQDQRIAQLLNQQRPGGPVLRSTRPPIQPPMERSLEYWAANIPDFGDTLSQDEIQEYLTTPRKQAPAVAVDRITQVPVWRHTGRLDYSISSVLSLLVGIIVVIFGSLLFFLLLKSL